MCPNDPKKRSIMLELATSRRTVLYLLLFAALVLVPTGLLYTNHILQTLLYGCLAGLGVSLGCCLFFRWRRLSFGLLLLHAGIAIILAGGALSPLGYVATVNLYENTSTDTVFRWDWGRDVQPGYSLAVGTIERQWYPVELKIGVLQKGKKKKLLQCKTGDHLTVDDLSVKVLDFDPEAKFASLAVSDKRGKGEAVILQTMEGEGNVEAPYSFVLVAYKTPSLKQLSTLLTITPENKEQPVSALMAVNQPVHWHSLRFFLTQVAEDDSGRSYIGIQITSDPGVALVYAGFAVLSVAVIFLLFQLCTGPDKKKVAQDLPLRRQ